MSESRESALALRERQELAAETAQATAQAVMQAMAPMMQGLAQISAAMAEMAHQTRMMQESIETMRKAMMRSMPLTQAQGRRLSDAIRERAASIASEYSLPEEARRTCNREIRKKLCRRWAVASVREIPSCEYELAVEAVEKFDESLIVERYL